MKPFIPWLGLCAGGLLTMVANMRRIENAARVAMADFSADASGAAVQSGTAWTSRLGLLLVLSSLASLVVIALL